QEKAGPEAVKIRALDRYTFQVELKKPVPYLENILPHFAFSVVPLHVIEKFGRGWTRPENFVGNGPFLLETWKPHEEMRCIPNPKYWDKKQVKLGRIIFLPVDDEAIGYNMYLNEECDWGCAVPPTMIQSAKGRKDFIIAPYIGTYYYVFQTRKPPLNDPRVRKALSISFSRDELLETVESTGQSAYGLVPPMPGYSGINSNKEEIAAAKDLLSEAGFPNGRGFPRLTILYNSSPYHRKIAEYIRRQWLENLGVRVETASQEWGTYLKSLKEGDYDIARTGWIGTYQDPGPFLEVFITGNLALNCGYSNHVFDDLMEKAATASYGKERFDVLRKVEELLINGDQVVMPIFTYVSHNMIDLDTWGGWYPNVMNYHPVKYIYSK
ncbi:MAG: peptide ABC transporter substrate-binding protein, partial [Spirochaetota bacterium]